MLTQLIYENMIFMDLVIRYDTIIISVLYCNSCIFIIVIVRVPAGIVAHYIIILSGEEGDAIFFEEDEDYLEETINDNEMI